jgi:hypothetical protein
VLKTLRINPETQCRWGWVTTLARRCTQGGKRSGDTVVRWATGKTQRQFPQQRNYLHNQWQIGSKAEYLSSTSEYTYQKLK